MRFQTSLIPCIVFLISLAIKLFRLSQGNSEVKLAVNLNLFEIYQTENAAVFSDSFERAYQFSTKNSTMADGIVRLTSGEGAHQISRQPAATHVLAAFVSMTDFHF